MNDRNQELISDAEEEQIQRMIDSDLDAPEVTDEQLAEDRLQPSRSGPFPDGSVADWNDSDELLKHPPETPPKLKTRPRRRGCLTPIHGNPRSTG